MKAIVLAGSRGIGKSITEDLSDICSDVVSTNSSVLDTSNIKQVKEFVSIEKETDILVLNTGGPPAKNFYEVTEDEWYKYHNQLFYSFVYILQNIKINKGGYIFLISSHQITEPSEKMSLSVTYRIAFSSVFKILSKGYAKNQISCINIAPGPIGTNRLKNLVGDLDEFEKTLPLGRVGSTKELSLFIKSIVENKLKYLTGVTINFDGGLSNYIF